MERVLELAKEINKWQRETFGEYTAEQQLLKLTEELSEYITAEDEDEMIVELTDVFISACGLLDTSFFGFAERYCRLCFELADNLEWGGDKFIGEIECKMEVNRNRTWVKGKNGVCRHVEPITDELKPMYDKFTGRTGNYEQS